MKTINSLTLFIIFLFTMFSCNKNITAIKTQNQYYYDCPVHKDYITHSPGKCSKCGLTLDPWELKIARKNSGNSHSGHSDSGGNSSGCH